MIDEDRKVNLFKIIVQDLDNKPETANELLDFLANFSEGIEEIQFQKWYPTVSSIEKEILNVLAAKSAPTLKSITVKIMQNASEPVRDALAHMVHKIIISDPTQLKFIDLNMANFSPESGEKIREALKLHRLQNMTSLNLIGAASWFDSDEKCQAFASAL